jgi:hypothetical protein
MTSRVRWSGLRTIPVVPNSLPSRRGSASQTFGLPPPGGTRQNDRLQVVGDVQRTAGSPGAIVRDRGVIAGRRRAVRPCPSGSARWKVAEPGVSVEPLPLDVPVPVQQQDTCRAAVQQHQSPARVARGHLDPLVARQVLIGDHPGMQDRAVARVLPDERGPRPAVRVRVCALIDPAVGRHVCPRRKAGLSDQREYPGVPPRSLLRRRGSRAGEQKDGERATNGGCAPHSSARISLAARSPERTAPSM